MTAENGLTETLVLRASRFFLMWQKLSRIPKIKKALDLFCFRPAKIPWMNVEIVLMRMKLLGKQGMKEV